MPHSPNAFEKRFLNFGTSVLRLTALLPNNKKGQHVADQLFRSATSVGAHMREARSAESRADLIHKMQLALKEAREAHYWLSLSFEGGLIKTDSLRGLVGEADELIAILVKSVLTAKSGHN